VLELNDIPAPTRAAIEAAPARAQAGLIALRRLIVTVAANEGIALREELRWGQPAYLAARGSTLRIGVPKSAEFALFVHCQTALIAEFRAGPGAGFRVEGTRAVLFDHPDEIRPEALAFLIHRALTWHDRKRQT